MLPEVLPDDWTAVPKVNRETRRRVSSRRNGDNLRFGDGMRKFRGVLWERMGTGETGMLEKRAVTITGEL